MIEKKNSKSMKFVKFSIFKKKVKKKTKNDSAQNFIAYHLEILTLFKINFFTTPEIVK